jgi:hypothetical protein
MQAHRKYSDAEFETIFESGQIPVAEFTHEAHLRLAWIHIIKYGVDQAIKNVTTQIRSFVTAIGAADKYDENLTVISVELTHRLMRESRCDTFDELLVEYPKLKSDFMGMARQWS